MDVQAASNRSPPLWALAAIGFLGWNEAVALLYNPIWLLVILLLGLFSYSLYKELDVDAEMQHGPLPAALSLAANFMPATRRVLSRSTQSLRSWLQPENYGQALSPSILSCLSQDAAGWMLVSMWHRVQGSVSHCLCPPVQSALQ